MFGNIKKKLSDAFQESLIIGESLQQGYLQRMSSATGATTSEERHTGESRPNPGKASSNIALPAHANVTAGCNLLAKYEIEWKAIHDANEENGQKATELAETIERIDKRTEVQCIVLTDLVTCLSGIPALVQKLNKSMETLQNVRDLSASAERKLEHLENISEECELHEFMLQKEYELSRYKQKKLGELELYRQKLAAEHEARVKQHEMRWLKIQRERQAVFEDAFRGDIEEYKQKGTLAKLNRKESSSELVLEEVDLADMEPKDALEKFLNG